MCPSIWVTVLEGIDDVYQVYSCSIFKRSRSLEEVQRPDLGGLRHRIARCDIRRLLPSRA
jgi:hypothetical protein